MAKSTKNSMQNFAINQALKYIESNPEENIPKLMAGELGKIQWCFKILKEVS